MEEYRMREILNELGIIPNLITTGIVVGILTAIFLLIRKTMDAIMENKMKALCVAMFIVGMYVSFASKVGMDFIDLSSLNKLAEMYVQNGIK